MSIRTQKVAEEIKHKMNSAMSKDLMELNLGLVTISNVTITADLKIAKIYFTLLGNKEPGAKAEEKLNNRKKHIRYLLAQSINLRYVPDLIFIYDDSYEYADKIHKILNDLKK